MRIVNFNASLIPEQDGVTRVMANLIRGAQERGHDVLCVGSAVPPAAKGYPTETIKVPSLGVPGRSEYRLAIPGYRGFARKVLAWKPDVLHIHSPCPLGFAAGKFGREFGIPVVATYHTHFPTYVQYYADRKWETRVWRLLRRLYNQLDATFVPALSVLDEVRAAGVRRTEYLPNAVDTSAFSPRYRSDDWRESIGARDKQVVLFTSRFVLEKNLKVLANAFKMLRERRNDFVMVCVGDGPARKQLQQMMPGAAFRGWLDDVPLSTSYASADVFMFPSISETFGLVTVEAMASGVVPAAARAGGAADIIRHEESGLLAERDDPASLAASVDRLLDQRDWRARLATNAMRRATEFGWEPMFDRLFARYEELCAAPRNAKREIEGLAR